MAELLRDHYIELISLISFIVAAVILALHKIGWIKLKKDTSEWNGTERRECAQHPIITQKVCGLYTKLDEVDKKLDGVAEKLQYVLGSLETRWRKIDSQ